MSSFWRRLRLTLDMILFELVSALAFCWSSEQFARLCLALAPVTLAIIFTYSYAKRFTMLAHLWFGLSLGIAPAAAWIDMRGTLDARILYLTAAVMFWT